jgi:hypothetical protein
MSQCNVVHIYKRIYLNNHLPITQLGLLLSVGCLSQAGGTSSDVYHVMHVLCTTLPHQTPQTPTDVYVSHIFSEMKQTWAS